MHCLSLWLWRGRGRAESCAVARPSCCLGWPGKGCGAMVARRARGRRCAPGAVASVPSRGLGWLAARGLRARRRKESSCAVRVLALCDLGGQLGEALWAGAVT